MEERIRVLCVLGLASSLSTQSQRTYSTAYRSWLRFCGLCKLHPVNEIISSDFDTTCLILERFISFECGCRQIAPQTISSSYLPGISWVFDMVAPGNHFRAASQAPRCKFLLSGFTKLYAKVHPEGRKIKIPFTLDLVCVTYDRLRGRASSFLENVVAYRTFLALAFGFMFLLRRSEYLAYVGKRLGNAVPFTRSLLFFYKDQERVPYHLIGHADHRATQMSIAIPYSKTDSNGVARILSHGRTRYGLDHSDGVCIVAHMEAWIEMTRIRFGVPASGHLFDCDPSVPDLLSSHLDHEMKLTAVQKGLPKDKVSSHSLRYGGATTLASVGAPQYLICFYGGWCDGSVRIYARPTSSALAFATDALTARHRALTQDLVVDHLIRSEISGGI